MTTTSATGLGPERPAHLGPDVTSVDTGDLLDACPGATDVRGLRALLAGRPRPLRRLDLRAAAIAGTDEAGAVLARAEAIHPDSHDVSGSTLPRSQRYGHHYLGWVEPLVTARLLTGDRRWTDRFEQVITRWHAGRADYRGDWPGLHVLWYSLGTWARSRQMLGWLDALGDELSDETYALLLANVLGNARWAHQEHVAFRPGNWQLVSATHLVEVGHVLQAFDQASAWLERGRTRTREHLRFDVRPDGGHAERSPSYHQMSLDAFHTVAATELSRRAAPDDTDMLGHPRFAAMHHWLATLATDGGWVPALQDSSLLHPGALLLRGAWLLGDVDLLARAGDMLGPAGTAATVAEFPVLTPEHEHRWRTLLAAVTRVAAGPRPREQVTVLPDSGYSLLRAGPLRAVLNHGPYVEHELESHSHRCLLDVTLDGWGTPLISEAGGPTSYDDPDYQGFHQSPAGHSTVQVDDIETRGPRAVHGPVAAVLDGWTIWTATHDRIPGDDGTSRHRRLVAMTSSPELVVALDTVEGADDRRVTLRWQLPGTAAAAADGLSWWNEPAHPGTARTGVHLLAAPAGAPLTTSSGRRPASHPVPGTQRAEPAPLTTLAWSIDGSGPRTEFVTVLTPVPPGAQIPVVERNQGGADSATGPTVVVGHPDGTVDRITSGQIVRTRPGGDEVVTVDLCAARHSDATTPVLPTVHHRSGDQERITVRGEGAETLRLPPTWLRTGAGPTLVWLDDVLVEASRTGTVTLPHSGTWTIAAAPDRNGPAPEGEFVA